MAFARRPSGGTTSDSLVALLDRAVPGDGPHEVRPGLFLYRYATPGHPMSGIVEPSLCVIAQGRKDVLLGDERYPYDSAHYLLTTMGLPITAHITEASARAPYLSLRLILDPAIVTEILVASGGSGGEPPVQRGLDVSALDADLRDAITRLVRLATNGDDDYRVLAPLVMREIVYRLSIGDQAARLRHLGLIGGRTHRMTRAVERLQRDFDQTLKMTDVARELGMSASTFHAHFKAATSMSPLQFQKQVRLHEARRLMLHDHLDASEAGYRVGYDDASYFSRDYKRQFGAPPGRDVERLRRELVE